MKEPECASVLSNRWEYVVNYIIAHQIKKEDICTKTDLWSVGVTVYYLLCGNILKRDKDVHKSFSEELKDFLRHLVEVNVSKRYNAKQALNHVWLNL